MTMKKFDLDKHMAKKLDQQLKTGQAPDRFGKKSAVVQAEMSKPNSLLAQLLKRQAS